MIILKVQSRVLNVALQDTEMRMLKMYLSSYKRTVDNCFICQEVDSDKGLVPEIKLSLFDYTFNERESDKIWQLAKSLLGKEIIDLQIVKRVEL
jgi:hypothetical protein